MAWGEGGWPNLYESGEIEYRRDSHEVDESSWQSHCKSLCVDFLKVLRRLMVEILAQ